MKKIKITPPEGYEIDKEASTFDCIKFKPVEKRNLTYEEIQKRNEGKKQYYIDSLGFLNGVLLPEFSIYSKKTYLPTPSIALKVEALCQLYIIADWYNDGWVADYRDNSQKKYYPSWDNDLNKIDYVRAGFSSLSTPAFKSQEVLMAAYEANREIFEKALKP